MYSKIATKDLVTKAKDFYNFYLAKKKECDAACLSANDGTYSQGYARQLVETANMQKQNAATELKTKLSKLKEDFEEAAVAESGILTDTPDRRLLALLNSGIQLTKGDFLALGKDFYGDQLNSRIIHEFAKKAGYSINNYLSVEKRMDIFNDYLRNIEHSTDDNSAFVPIPEELSEKIAQNYINLLNPSILDMEIEDIPQSLEEGIAQDMRKQSENEEKKLDGKSFLDGLNGANDSERIGTD